MTNFPLSNYDVEAIQNPPPGTELPAPAAVVAAALPKALNAVGMPLDLDQKPMGPVPSTPGTETTMESCTPTPTATAQAGSQAPNFFMNVDLQMTLPEAPDVAQVGMMSKTASNSLFSPDNAPAGAEVQALPKDFMNICADEQPAHEGQDLCLRYLTLSGEYAVSNPLSNLSFDEKSLRPGGSRCQGSSIKSDDFASLEDAWNSSSKTMYPDSEAIWPFTDEFETLDWSSAVPQALQNCMPVTPWSCFQTPPK